MGNAPGTSQVGNFNQQDQPAYPPNGSNEMDSYKYSSYTSSFSPQSGIPGQSNHSSNNGLLLGQTQVMSTSNCAPGNVRQPSSYEACSMLVDSPNEHHSTLPSVTLPPLYEHSSSTPPSGSLSPGIEMSAPQGMDVLPSATSLPEDSFPSDDHKPKLPSCFNETFNVDALAGRLHGTSLTEVIQQEVAKMENRLPCVFKWSSGGREVFLVGSFNSWGTPVPMVKSDDCFYVIVKLWPGRHEYKFNVDGRWYHDPNQPTVCNEYGTLNNVIEVRPSDFNVMDALEADMMECQNRNVAKRIGASSNSGGSSSRRFRSISGGAGTSSGSGTGRLRLLSQHSDDDDYGQVLPSAVVMAPPQLPQQLLQANLNSETSRVCDPNLLPAPHHVMVNHLYALSIKDGVIVLSCITRFRNKFVTTVYYKPI